MSNATAGLKADNPFSTQSTLPLRAPAFDQIREEHYVPAFQAGMEQHLIEVRKIASQSEAPSFANTIEAMERAGAVLDRVSYVFFNLIGSTVTDGLQKIQAEVSPLLAAHRCRPRVPSRRAARARPWPGRRSRGPCMRA